MSFYRNCYSEYDVTSKYHVAFICFKSTENLWKGMCKFDFNFFKKKVMLNILLKICNIKNRYNVI